MKKNNKKSYKKLLPKYAEGGFLDTLQNAGALFGDNALSMIGLSNVADNNNWYTDSGIGKTAKDISKYTNKFSAIGGQIGANILAPGIGGAALGAVQSTAGSFDQPKQQNPQLNPQQGNLVNEQFRKQYVMKNGGMINNWSKDKLINLNAPIMYPNGGMINQQSMNPNAQLEKQEVIKNPDGTTNQVDAPSHNQGGINLNLPQGAKIFSDNLKASNGKTFAKLAEQFKNHKWEKTLNDKDADPLKKKTAQMMFNKNEQKLDQLFQEQESLKQQKAIKAFNGFQKKYGGQIPMFYNGGLNLANGSLTDEMANYYNNGLNPMKKGFEFTPGTSDGSNQFIPEDNSLATQAHNNAVIPNSGNLINGLNESNSFTPAKERTPFNWKRAGFEAGNALVQNLGNLAYLYDQGKSYDKVDYGRINAKTVDPTEAIKDIRNSSNNVASRVPNLTGGHGGQALSSLMANASNRDRNISKTRLDFENQNAGILNQNAAQNQAYKIQGMQDEANNKGQALTNYYQTLGQLGMNAAGQYKDATATDMNNYNVDLISNSLQNFDFDKKTGRYSRKRLKK